MHVRVLFETVIQFKLLKKKIDKKNYPCIIYAYAIFCLLLYLLLADSYTRRKSKPGIMKKILII